MVLFSGEQLNFREKDEASTTSYSDEQINQKYIKGEMRIVTEQARYPLPSIPDMVNSKEKKYKLDPEFQRRLRWSHEKQSRLIESFIINVPIPPIFLYEYEYSFFEVMDGLQRLTAISQFYKDEFALEGLEEWPELNGKTYSELPEKIKEGIDRRYLSSIILLHETAKNKEEARILKQKVFERINSGGELLEPQESRNAIYDGPLNRLCMKLSENSYFIKAWGFPTVLEIKSGKISEKDNSYNQYRKMYDVELVLRFLAYRQRQNADVSTQKNVLDKYLQLGNKFSNEVLSNLENLFKATIKLVFEIFEGKAFWLWRSRADRKGNISWYWLERPTTVVYDPLMFVFSQYVEYSNEIIQHKEIFQQKITEFYENNPDAFEGREVGKSYQEKRIQLYHQFIKDILKIN